MRLRTRLSLSIGLAWVFVMGLLYLLVSSDLTEVFEARAHNCLVIETQTTVQVLNDFLHERQSDLAILAATLGDQRARIPTTKLLTKIRDTYESYEWLRATDATGVVVADTNQMELGTVDRTEFPFKPGYQIEFHQGPRTHGMQAHLHLHDQNGCIEACVPLQRLHRHLSDSNRWPAGSIITLSVNDQVVFSSEPSRAPMAEATLSSPDDLVVTEKSQAGWIVQARLPRAAWQSVTKPILNSILLVAVIGALGGALLIKWTAGRLTKPLDRLAQSAHEYASTGKAAFAGLPSDPQEVRQVQAVLSMTVARLENHIDHLKNAGERMRLAAHLAGLGAWECDSRAGIMTWDDGMVSLYGTTRAKLTNTATDWTSRVLPEDLPAQLAAFQTSLSTGAPFRGRFRIRRDDGSVRWIDTEAEVRRDQQGLIYGISGINIDVTNHIHAEVKLRMAATAAEAAAQVKADFLATMSHEIRTPLNGVIGMVDLLLDTQLDPEQADMAKIISNSGRTLLSIVNDILDFSKIEAGKLELEMVPFRPTSATEEIIALMKPQALAKGLTLNLAIAPSCPPALLGDEARFRQILFNLLGNAVKFTAHGTISAELFADETHLIIAIRDSGIGMSEEDQKKLFQRFSQVDTSMNRRFGGTGLGLAISHRLATAMGGSITVESAPGCGSTFSLKLPLPTTAVVMPSAKSDDRTPILTQSKLKILLAEDNPVNQIVSSAMVRKLGHEVVLAVNGVAAVAAWQSGDFDLILMDMQMPEMDGLEATLAIRTQEALNQHIPIIALTANAMNEDRAACLAAGMDAVIIKPVTAVALAAVLAAHAPRQLA